MIPVVRSACVIDNDVDHMVFAGCAARLGANELQASQLTVGLGCVGYYCRVEATVDSSAPGERLELGPG